MKTSFENFTPRLRPGRVIPQGARLIYETTDGRHQIILPIEMADLILLANGNYSMRQIIEKTFRRKGSVHFRSIFRTVHQLRDNGFFENGADLESYGWWSRPSHYELRWFFEWPLLARQYGYRPHALRFYFLSLITVGLAGYSLVDFPWPPLDAKRLALAENGWLAFVFLFVLNSILLSVKAGVKLLFQTILTGTFFGVRLRLTPWGLYPKTLDEPIFLINNRLFLILYHLGVVCAPLLVVWPLAEVSERLHLTVSTIVVLQLAVDLSPFGDSELMRTIRALLSLGHSDMVAGYLRENSLLSLLAPVGRPSLTRRLKWWFSLYVWIWMTIVLWISVVSCRALSEPIHRDLGFEIFGWFAFAGTGAWVLFHGWRQTKELMIQPILEGLHRRFLRLKSWRQSSWTQERILDALLRLPLFSYFSTPLLERILEKSELLNARVGSRLITQGEVGQHLFVLLEGNLKVERATLSEGRRALNQLRPISIFGEMAIVEESERTADVVSAQDSTVLKIPGEALRQAANESQYVREIEAFRNAIIVNQFFTSAPMFRDLPEDVIHDITMRSSMRHLQRGEVIIRQGEYGKSFFMVLRGSVEVSIDGSMVKRIQHGGFFGEISLIADIPRTATVKSHEATVLLEMAASSFWEVLCQNIELALFIEAVGESRLAEDIQGGVPSTSLSRSVG